MAPIYQSVKFTFDNTAETQSFLRGARDGYFYSRNGNPTRIRNRCELTSRPRAYYRKFRLCRVQLRDLANKGLIPGVTKSSW